MLDRITRGTVAGLAGGLAVAVLVLVYDLVQLEPFATPQLLAANVLGAPVASDGLGALDWAAGVALAAWGVTLYTMAHFGIFALLGIGAAWVFAPGAMPGNLLTGALFGTVAGTVVFYAGLLLLAPTFITVPDWRLVLATNAVAGIVLVSQLIDHSATDGGSG